jgi:hypothetical protein
VSEHDDDCIHDMPPGTCSICKERQSPKPDRGPRGGGIVGTLDTPASVERYRSRYPGDREPTFEAYVKVFFSRARDFPGGWTYFSRCANAEPALVRDSASHVRRAEEIMTGAGYVADDSGRPGKGRRWWKQA